jgi:mevalonate kinase
MHQERNKFLSPYELLAKAPASFYWAGEHVVAYGQLAIIQTIPLYAWVGLEFGYFDSFEFDVRVVREDTNIPTSLENRLRVKKIRDKWKNEKYVKRVLASWKEEANFDQFFKVRIWSEIPPQCGLNSSGAIGSALAALLYKLENNVEYKKIMEHLKAWRSKKVSELKKDDVFLDIFAKAWLFDDCFHRFSSSGMGPFSSMVGHSECEELLVCFTEAKGFNSDHKIKRTSVDYASLVQEIKAINFWATRVKLSENVKKAMQVSVIFSGTPKATGLVLEQQENWFRISVESFQQLLLSVLDEKELQDGSLAKPISDFIVEYHTKPTDAEHFPKTIFMQSLGLLSWVMLKAIMDGDLDHFFSIVRSIHDYHVFYNVFSGSLVACKEYIEKQIIDHPGEDLRDKCASKLTGAGGGGDLTVFMKWNAAVKLENDINKKAEKGEEEYQIHYSTRLMGWEVEGLELLKPLERVKKESIYHTFVDCEFQNELEIGIEGTPYVKINGEEIYAIQPRFFADLVFFAVSLIVREKDGGWVAEHELKPNWSQELSELRDFLMKGNYKENVNKLDIIPRATNKKTRLQAFKEITIHKSICSFDPVSSHLRRIVNAFKEITSEKEKKMKLTSEEIDLILFTNRIDSPDKLESQIASKKRQADLVSRAAEMLRWKFHDQNRERDWHGLIQMAEGLVRILQEHGIIEDPY